MAIETARLRLRRWRPDDVEPWAAIVADPEVMRHLGSGALTHDDAGEQIERFERHWVEHGFGHWAVEERSTGAMIGRVGLLHHDDWSEDPENVEVGWTIERSRWRRGLATEGARASLRFGFDGLRLERVISIARRDNHASRRVMEKTGLDLRDETDWRSHRVVWYAIERATWAARDE